MKILATGGLGYIGSHTVVELINAGYEPIIVDDLSNSKIKVLDRLETITGKKIKFYQIDCKDEAKLDTVFKENDIFACIHFAGYKSVGESVAQPEKYYYNNIGSAKALVKVMKKNNVKNLIFSSSATVYGNPRIVPILESEPIGDVTNPYGETKVLIEKLLMAECQIDKDFNVVLLRYFNPIGAHASGLIGEDPVGIPNNLMPYITQVAVGKLPQLRVFGNDYDTVDGTGVRDYIHVVDLAIGHVKSVSKLKEKCGLVVYNLGTGVGTSVLELVHAFEEANNIKIPYEIVDRRPGDIASCYANCEKAFKEMGFKSKYTMVDACRDSWNWQSKNPKGFEE